MKLLKYLVKNETVFCVSFLLALVSAFFVHPDAGYLAYPDYRTIALLFCLMIVIAGLQSLKVFYMLGESLLKRAHGVRSLSFVMVLLCFFGSMVITNDVALITFVPFTIFIFRMGGQGNRILRLIVLETIAANLGSMATPIGNPQNLYLYSISNLSAADFARATLPYAGLALLLLVIVLLAARDEPLLEIMMGEEAENRKKEKGIEENGRKKKGKEKNSLFPAVVPYLLMLALCLLVVFRVLPYQPVLIFVIAAALILKRKLYWSVDYFLLLTFFFFFIFIGNIKRIPLIDEFLVSVVQGREMLTGILASQVISNVPAAILLSGFAGDVCALLTGVNLGGLGTLIASLASRISFKFFAREYPDQKGQFLKEFTFWNILFLFALTAAALLL